MANARTKRPRGRPRDEDLAQRRREEILEVATRLFAARGFPAMDVQDVADAVVASLDAPAGTYNVGSGQGTNVNTMARLLIDRLAPGTVPEHLPAHPAEVRHSVADITAAQRAFGYAPARPLASHLDEVIASVAARLGMAPPTS